MLEQQFYNKLNYDRVSFFQPSAIAHLKPDGCNYFADYIFTSKIVLKTTKIYVH